MIKRRRWKRLRRNWHLEIIVSKTLFVICANKFIQAVRGIRKFIFLSSTPDFSSEGGSYGIESEKRERQKLSLSIGQKRQRINVCISRKKDCSTGLEASGETRFNKLSACHSRHVQLSERVNCTMLKNEPPVCCFCSIGKFHT